MANVALLIGTGSIEAPTEYEPPDALAAGNYCIPLLWLSLFDPMDLTPWPCTLDPTETYTALAGERTRCVARSAERVARWSARWPDLEAVAGPWQAFLNGLTVGALGVWTEDVSDMSGDDAFAADLRGWIGGLDAEDSPGFAAALAQSSLRLDPDVGGALRSIGGEPLGLVAAGYAWSTAVPWATD